MIGAIKVDHLEPDWLAAVIVLLAEQHFQLNLPIGVQECPGIIP
jgi:hypothetical protein